MSSSNTVSKLPKGKKVFQITSANTLVEFFEDKEKEIKNKIKQAEKIALEINKIQKKIPEKQEATIYRGIRGIKSFYNETLKLGTKEFVVFGEPQASVEIMGKDFWLNYEAKRAAVKLKARLLFNPSLREYGKTLKTRFTEIRYFEKDFEPLTETHIQENRVAIIVWTEEPVLFLLQDKFIAASYKKFFEDMWKIAEP